MPKENPELIPISPISIKEICLQDSEFLTEHRKIIDNPQFNKSVIMALAALARSSISEEAMKGANAFIDTFSMLAEKDKPSGTTFPVRKLT